MKKRIINRKQKLTIVHGILTVILVIVILQLWLFTASMEAYLGGDHAILVPAALASLVCLGLIAGLMWYIYALD